MNTPTCLRCGEGTALYLETLGPPTDQHCYFCCTDCAAEFGVMSAYVNDRHWCYWCQKWTHKPGGRCTTCKQTTQEGRDHASAQGPR